MSVEHGRTVAGAGRFVSPFTGWAPARGGPGRGPVGRRGSAELPLLVALPVAGPQLDEGAVGRRGSADIQAEARLDAGDGAVGVARPLLVGLPVAGPDDRPGAVGGALGVGVEAQLAAAGVDRQLAGGRGGPGLVGPAGAGVDLGLGAAGGAGARDVQALS